MSTRFAVYLCTCTGLVIGMGASLLWHFFNIVRYGEHLIKEPNPVILLSEIVLVVLTTIGCAIAYIIILRRYL